MSNFIQSIVNGFTTISDKLVNLKDAITALNNIYVSKSDLNAPFNPPSLDGNGMIRSHQIPQSAMPLKQVANIATRDALTNLPSPCQVFVVDASADGVTGGAYYLYTSENGYVKTSNAGDVQLEVDYLDIKNKPLTFNPSVHTHDEYVNKSDKTSYLKNIKINGQNATVIDNVANITIDVQQVVSNSGSPIDMSMYAYAIHNHDDMYVRYDYLLDSVGKFKADLMPKITISDTFDVNNQVQMLGLVCEKGDMARRMDFTPPKIFVLQGDDPAVLSNWIEISVTTDITATINSQKGIAGGLLPLNSQAKIDLKYLPEGIGSSSSGTASSSVIETTSILMHFNGNNNDTIITEEYGNVVTKTGNPKLSSLKSKFGNTSLYLDGTSYIKFAGSSKISTIPNKTISFFMCPEIIDANYRALVSDRNGAGSRLCFGFKLGKIICHSQTAMLFESGNASNQTLVANTMYHVAIIIASSSIQVFIDGELYHGYNGSIDSSTVPSNLYIGFDPYWTYFKGWIDELKISSTTTKSTFTVPTVEYAS